MVKVQRYWWVFFLLLVAVPLAHAESYGLTVNAIDNTIQRNETATFEVVLSNFGDRPAEFQASTIDPQWSIKVQPLGLVVQPKSQLTATLFLRPSSSVPYSTQGVVVNFRELNTDWVLRKTVFVGIQSPEAGEYAPAVNLDIAMPYELDPRQQVPLRLELRNRNPLNITNLTIHIASPHFTTDSQVNLAPLSEKTKDVTGITMDPRAAPREGEVVVQLLYNGQEINRLVKNYRIKEYTQIKQRIGEENFFFKSVKNITVTNDGNVKNTAVISVPTSLVKSLFVSSSLPYEVGMRDDQRVILWNVPLDPNETRSLTYTENYRILVLLALLAIIGGIAYFFLRSPVVALKEAVAVAHTDGVSDIKVRVFVKNRSAKIIQGIQVTDRVPSLADVMKTESPGSIAPTKVATSEKQGTLLRWELEVLEPFEERILTYQVKSKLKIIGRMKLPNAKIRFVAKGKERVVYSNNIELVEKFKDK